MRQAEPVLRVMGSTVNHLGPLGAGALAKLVGNALMGVQVTALAELIGLIRRSGADPASVFNAVSTTNVWSPLAGRASASMLAGDFTPLFPVELLEKDLGYALDQADGTAPILAAARRTFESAVSHGLGGEHMTAVVKLLD